MEKEESAVATSETRNPFGGMMLLGALLVLAGIFLGYVALVIMDVTVSVPREYVAGIRLPSEASVVNLEKLNMRVCLTVIAAVIFLAGLGWLSCGWLGEVLFRTMVDSRVDCSTPIPPVQAHSSISPPGMPTADERASD